MASYIFQRLENFKRLTMHELHEIPMPVPSVEFKGTKPWSLLHMRSAARTEIMRPAGLKCLLPDPSRKSLLSSHLESKSAVALTENKHPPT